MLFDQYFNVVPDQGSRTIRTEEAVLITLSAMSDKLQAEHEPPEFKYKELIAQSEDTGNVQTTLEPMKRKNKVKKKKQEVTVATEEEIDINMDRFD